jgi:hypothetical protein
LCKPNEKPTTCIQPLHFSLNGIGTDTVSLLERSVPPKEKECTAEPTLLCTLESKGWKLEVAQISGNAHTFIIRYYLMSKVVTKEELEAGMTGVTEK